VKNNKDKIWKIAGFFTSLYLLAAAFTVSLKFWKWILFLLSFFIFLLAFARKKPEKPFIKYQ